MPRSAATTDAALSRYKQKRDFKVTPEPSDAPAPRSPKATAKKPAKHPAEKPAPHAAGRLSYVIQKHWARRLHYDFRLELDGVMLSWAVPRGPSYDPAAKRMAVHVEDHPVSYGSFEGTIPPRQYGAGTVMVWDHGTWEPVGDPRDSMKAGKLVFKLHGEKLAGLWELVRISKADAKQDQWMLFKKRDEWAKPLADYDVITALPDSVVDHPLGLIEDREARVRAGKTTPTSGTGRASTPIKPDLSKAVKAELPAKLKPQLATLVSTPPAGNGWAVEPKFDGYRILARIEKGKPRFITRGGHDWTHKMRSLAAAVEELGVASAWLDGEIVVMNEQGVPDFNALQNAIDNRTNEDIVYFVFDAPYFDGRDLRQVPLSSRRSVLRTLFKHKAGERVRFSEDFDAPPIEMLEAACQMHLEGIILKRLDAPYVSGRTETWLKLKCSLRQEFVICGFTDRSGASNEVGGLLLGYYENGKLRYAGNVGTGWDSATGRKMHGRLAKLEVDKPTLDADTVRPGRWSKRAAGTERWVKPELVAEVVFAAWTPEGHVRHASFKGLRADKPGELISRERAAESVAPSDAAEVQRRIGRETARAGVKVSNPARVIDPSSGLKKLDLVRYYESVADWILPHLQDRPVSLVRAPEGIMGELFFQKHPESRMPGMRVLDASLWPGHAPLLAVETVTALIAAAQMNVIEFHTWNSTAKEIDQPDRMVFDLDPGEGITWTHLQEAALLTRTLLAELQLESWLKTSGGKGLHVVVPLVPRQHYDVVKGFSQAVVRHLARTIPSRFVARSGPSNRVGKIFVDYIRNGHGQTTATAFSARARPGMGVSMPIAWEQLMTLKNAAQWTVATAREYLSFQKIDPWAGYWQSPQTLAPAMEMLDFKPAESKA